MLNKDVKLNRQISLTSLIFLGVGSMIGSGWLFGSFFSAQLAGPSAILAWMIAAIISLLIALPLAEIGTFLPVSGSFIEMTYLTHGNLSGFLLSVLAWLGMASIPAIEVQGILLYIGNYWPTLLVQKHHIYLLSQSGYLVGIALLVIFTAINFFTIGFVTKFNTYITLWKILMPTLAIIIFLSVAFHPTNFTRQGFAPYHFHGISQALISGGVIYSLLGFLQVITVAGEVKKPQRTIPLALIISLFITAVIYILLQTAFISALEPQWFAHGWAKLAYPHDKGPLAGLAENFGLIWLAVLLYVDAIISPSGTGLIYTTSTARVVYSIAHKKGLPQKFTYLNRFNSPVLGLLLNLIYGIAFLFLFSGWQSMAGFIVLAMVLTYAIPPVSLAASRTQLPNQMRHFKLPAGILCSAIAFILCNGIAYLAGWDLFKPLFFMLVISLLLFFINQWRFNTLKQSDWKNGLWFVIYLLGMISIAHWGQYGHGRKVLTSGVDFIVVALWSLIIFYFSWRSRLEKVDMVILTEGTKE